MPTTLIAIATSAALLIAAFPPWSAKWTGVFALVPWLYALRGRSHTWAIGSGLALGTAVGAGIGFWIGTGLLRRGADSIQAVTALLLCSLFVVGLPFALLGLVARLSVRLHPFVSALSFAIGAAAIEWARGAELALPWGLLGQTQAAVPGVAQLAAIGGVPLVSALVAGLNYSIAEAWARRSHAAVAILVAWTGAYAAASLLGLPVALATLDFATSLQASNLLLVQSRIPSSERWSPASQRTNLALLGRQTLEALASAQSRIDLILWPETSLTTSLDDDEALHQDFRAWMQRFGVPLLFGGVSPTTGVGLYRNSALWAEPDGSIAGRFDKTRAVPFIEGMAPTPLGGAIASLLGAPPNQRFAEEAREQSALAVRFPLAVVLCFEVVYPRLVAARTEPDTLAIVNLANDSWYDSDVVGAQQLAFASFRAIEQRKFVVRVADGGPSAVLDPFGRIVRELGPGEHGAVEVRIEGGGGPQSHDRIALTALALGGASVGALALQLTRRFWR